MPLGVNFDLKSEFQTIHRRPFDLAVPAILKPTNIRPVVDGEFFQLATAVYKMERGGDNAGNLTDEASVPSFVFAAERGNYVNQAIQKGPFLFGGFFEADTLIMDATALAVGDPLGVWDLDIGGIIRRGLGKWSAGFVIGYATRLPSTNNNKLRFIRTTG